MVVEAISEFQKLSLSKRGWVRNLSCDNEFHLHQKKKTFHTSGFALSRDLGKRNLRSDVFPFFSLKARKAWVTYIGMIEIRHDLRLGETRKWPQKMRKQQQQQTSKELNDASLSLFICCWAVTNLKIEEINQIIPIIQSKYFSVSAWLNPGLIPFNCIRKYPHPPRRELEIPWGWGVRGPGNSRGEGGWTINPLSRG